MPIKSAERHGVLVLYRAHELLVRRRAMLVNAFRRHSAVRQDCAEVRASGAGTYRGGAGAVQR